VIAELIATLPLDISFHAVNIDTGREVGHYPDTTVVPASVFKVPVLVELCRQAASGELDATSPIQIPVAGRAFGPFGISVLRDQVTMSLRDLAWQMIGFSDNAATDVICAHVGLDRVNARLTQLGLTTTWVDADCRDLLATMLEDAGVDRIEDFPTYPEPELLAKLRCLDPQRSPQRTTAREMTSLLRMIWRDEAADSVACSEMRNLLGRQLWPHRLASGFPEDDVSTAGKTGTLPCVRNEVGVVTYPDGDRYAVAVFTRRPGNRPKDPEADSIIGRIARTAIDVLRGAS
jgi:beta-lactamase class A